MAPLAADEVGVGIDMDIDIGMDMDMDMGMDMDMSPDADGAEVLRLAIIAAASLGETVVVLINELGMLAFEPMPLGFIPLELDDEEPL